MSIDITQLQADIAAIEQVVDQIDSLIPGAFGDKIRGVVTFVETIVDNPMVQQLILLVLSQLPAGASLQQLKDLVNSMQ